MFYEFYIWAKLPKSGKLEKSEKNYNFLKLVPNVVNFFLHFVKFNVGLRNNHYSLASPLWAGQYWWIYPEGQSGYSGKGMANIA